MLGVGVVVGGKSGFSWLMVFTGCVVRGVRRSGVVVVGEIVLVRGVGRVVVVVLSGGEVVGFRRERGYKIALSSCLRFCYSLVTYRVFGILVFFSYREMGRGFGFYWVW